MSRIFRQEALERLASPEQLDHLMQVIRPKDWLILVLFAMLAAAAVLWSCFGHLPTAVAGRGVLVRPRSIVAFQAPATGRLAALEVSVGDHVEAGQRLGTIDQADMRQRLQDARLKLQTLLAQDQTQRRLQDEQLALQAQQHRIERQSMALQRNDIRKQRRDAEAKTPLLKQRLENRQRLETLGLLPRLSDERLQAEQAYQDNLDKIAALKAQDQQLQARLKQVETARKRDVLVDIEDSASRQNAIQAAQSQIAQYEGKLERAGQIVSPHSGRILEITAHANQRVEAGMRLGTIERSAPGVSLMGVAYFPSKTGSKIAPGMTIHIAPDAVSRARFGSMVGAVRSVSSFPVTREGMQSLVGSPEVVETLLAQGPTLEVLAELQPNPDTVSQYQWSSSQGPPLRLTSGATMTARVVVTRRAPITYVLPILREMSGVY